LQQIVEFAFQRVERRAGVGRTWPVGFLFELTLIELGRNNVTGAQAHSGPRLCV
jgi:hypothetical protein